MKWLTQEQVKKHATTPTKALNVSIKHHQQVVDATEEELITKNCPALLTIRYCGLCIFFYQRQRFRCEGCPLKEIGKKCERANSVWLRASVRYDWFLNAPAVTGRYEAFKKAERKMLKVLKSLKGAKK